MDWDKKSQEKMNTFLLSIDMRAMAWIFGHLICWFIQNPDIFIEIRYEILGNMKSLGFKKEFRALFVFEGD